MDELDLAGISRALDDYCRHLDDGNEEAWLDLFAPEGRLLVGTRQFAGRDGLATFLAGRSGGPGLHLNTLPAIWSDGADDVRTDVAFFGLKPEAGATVVSGVGRYHDHLRRIDGRWLFVERRVSLAEGF